MTENELNILLTIIVTAGLFSWAIVYQIRKWNTSKKVKALLRHLNFYTKEHVLDNREMERKIAVLKIHVTEKISEDGILLPNEIETHFNRIENDIKQIERGILAVRKDYQFQTKIQ